jgi:hypothetical protein
MGSAVAFTALTWTSINCAYVLSGSQTNEAIAAIAATNPVLYFLVMAPPLPMMTSTPTLETSSLRVRCSNKRLTPLAAGF